MLRRHLLVLVSVLPAGRVAHAQRAFAPGQVWSIKATQPTSAKVVIGRIESPNGRIVVHVSMIDVPVPEGLPNAGGTITIGHMPFDQAALAQPVDRLVGVGVASSSDFEGGYRNWQEAKGGIFTIGVSQALEFAFDAMRRARPPRAN
jgi:hypothetical protein